MNSLTLSELSECVKMAIKSAFSTPVWVRAEISEIHENINGHCYLELVEKSPAGDMPIAKQKATIWAFTYRMLKPYFESATGTQLAAGMQILVSCQVEFHELYGVSLNVRDIDPTFTVGEMAARRAEIVRRLTDEGVIDMNKALPMPLVPQRVAVISSATAAGYGDFCEQLWNNEFGYKFYVKLFPAIMQGAKTEESVIEALGKIFDNCAFFDVVVIIRGGGATSDLAAFDNYNLALHCAQFPLPIVSGIGHQRDESIIDLVAHTRVKTPTAAAEFLISQVSEYENFVDSLAQNSAFMARDVLQTSERTLQKTIARLSVAQRSCLREQGTLQTQVLRLSKATKTAISSEENRISLLEKTVDFSDPKMLLKRGYSLTIKNGKIVRQATALAAGDVIETHFADGNVQSVVRKS